MTTERLWKKVYVDLHAFVLRRVREESLADDLVQEIFIKMHLKIGQLRDEEKVEHWLYQIARRTIIDYYRSGRKIDANLPDLPLEETTGPSEEDFTRQLAGWLPSAIESLPEKYREAVYLAEIEGLSQKELAERLQLSYSGAKSRVQRGREKLREIILDCCEVATDPYGNVLGYEPRCRDCK